MCDIADPRKNYCKQFIESFIIGIMHGQFQYNHILCIHNDLISLDIFIDHNTNLLFNAIDTLDENVNYNSDVMHSLIGFLPNFNCLDKESIHKLDKKLSTLIDKCREALCITKAARYI